MTLNQFIFKIIDTDYVENMLDCYIADNGKNPTRSELVNYILVRLPITQFPPEQHQIVVDLLNGHLMKDDEWDDTEMRYPEDTPPFIPDISDLKIS